MKIYLGIDVSKKHLDIDYAGQSSRIANSKKAIGCLLKSLPAEAMIICESSGGYEATLMSLTHASGVPIARLNALRVRNFAKAKGLLAKTDKIDARVMVAFAQAFDPAPQLPPDPCEQHLAALIKLRSHLLTQITQNTNFTDAASDPAVATIIARTVASLKKQVKNLTVLIAEKVRQSARLDAKVRRLEQVQGIGSLTASSLVALMPELGTLSDTQAAALAGVAPFNHDSGQFRGQRHIRGGRSQLRDCLKSQIRKIDLA
jgi:transposase